MMTETPAIAVLHIKIGNEQLLCRVTSNSLAFYAYDQSKLSYRFRNDFKTDIVSAKVIPNQHREVDYVFLVNAEGSYGFWSVDGGF